MRELRPFPKELLKKMFLKVLYENKGTDSLNSKDSNFMSIICEILTDHFHVSQLTEKEFNEIVQAINELQDDGFITLDPISFSSKHKELTEKGYNYVTTKLSNFVLPALEVEKFITRKDLMEQCLPDYLNGDYETSVLKAFSLVEMVTKMKIAKSSRLLPKDELSDSYISEGGKYIAEPDEAIIGVESLHRIMIGTMSWFNNFSGEKVRSFNYSQAAAQVLLFTNLHLNVIDQKRVAI